jgi:hypothetical protein
MNRHDRVLQHVLDELHTTTAERDALIEATRDALGRREPQWFPDGFPNPEAAVDAITWLGEQLHHHGSIPSRYDPEGHTP